MKFRLFSYLFYRQYQMNLTSPGDPAWLRGWNDPTWAANRGYAAVSVSQMLNVITGINLLDDFARTNIWGYLNRLDTLEFVGTALIFCMISVLVTFGPIPDSKRILAVFDGMNLTENQRKRWDLYLWIYVVGSFLLILISIFINPAAWSFSASH